MNDYNIRVACIKDAEELLEIYSYYVENTAITFEYDVPTLAEFEERMKRIIEEYPYIVMEMDGKIVGYAYAGQFKNRPAYDWCVETSIYVHKDYKGRGIGRELYRVLEDILKLQNILNLNACIAYIDEDDEYLNKDSTYFHEKMGYRLVGEFYKCGYKCNRWYNMIWMEKFIGEHVENQPSVIKFRDLDISSVEKCTKK